MKYVVTTGCAFAGTEETHLVEIDDECDIAIEDIADELLASDVEPYVTVDEIDDDEAERLQDEEGLELEFYSNRE